MSNYRQIHTRMWASDTWFSSLNSEFKLLFIYLFSNERASACGLYELPLRIISFETGLRREQVVEGFEIFAKADKAKYDPETGVVWIRNMFKFQASTSPRLAARIEADIKAAPDCDLKSEALRYLRDTVSIGYGYGTGTPLSISSSDSHSVPFPDPGVRTEGEGAAGSSRRSPNGESETQGARATGKTLQAYENNIGMLTPLVAESLLDDERDYGADWVCAAIQEAVKSEARNLKYVEAILARWKRDGFKSARPPPAGRWQAEAGRAAAGEGRQASDAAIIRKVARGESDTH